MPLTIPIIIAVGGQGRRMGGDKPFCELGAHMLVEHAINFARRHARLIAFAVGIVSDKRLPAGIPQICDRTSHAGPMSALESAALFAEQRSAEHFVMIGCDMPFLPDDLVTRLDAARDGKSGAVLAQSGQRIHPAAALWLTKAARSALQSTNERRSLMACAEAAGMATTTWADTPFDPFFNVNTPDDLATAEAILNTQVQAQTSRKRGI